MWRAPAPSGRRRVSCATSQLSDESAASERQGAQGQGLHCVRVKASCQQLQASCDVTSNRRSRGPAAPPLPAHAAARRTTSSPGRQDDTSIKPGESMISELCHRRKQRARPRARPVQVGRAPGPPVTATLKGRCTYLVYPRHKGQEKRREGEDGSDDEEGGGGKRRLEGRTRATFRGRSRPTTTGPCHPLSPHLSLCSPSAIVPRPFKSQGMTFSTCTPTPTPVLSPPFSLRSSVRLP